MRAYRMLARSCRASLAHPRLIPATRSVLPSTVRRPGSAHHGFIVGPSLVEGRLRSLSPAAYPRSVVRSSRSCSCALCCGRPSPALSRSAPARSPGSSRLAPSRTPCRASICCCRSRLVLWLMPDRPYRSKAMRATVLVGAFVWMFALTFVGCRRVFLLRGVRRATEPGRRSTTSCIRPKWSGTSGRSIRW